ncbi:MAG: hypothetical protein M3R69_00675 [Acidobacteriota bacterium]|nr:hypothetical protein [Acidobacteriota bacterium]
MKRQMRHPGYMASMILAAMLLLVAASHGSVRAAPAVRQPLIMVHYMPRFEAKPFSQRWGWH